MKLSGKIFRIKSLAILAIIIGVSALLLSFLVDFIGIGGQGGFGGKQLYLAIAGSISLLVGIVLSFSAVQKYLNAWRMPKSLQRPDPAVYLFALWFGLFTGLVKVLYDFYRHSYKQIPIGKGTDIVWLWPLSEILFFLLVGWILVIILKGRPKLNWFSSSLVILAFLSYSSILFLAGGKLAIWAVLLFSAGLAVVTSQILSRYTNIIYFLVYHLFGWPWLLVRRRKVNQVKTMDSDGAVNNLVNEGPSISRREFLAGAGLIVGGLFLAEGGLRKISEIRQVSSLKAALKGSPNIIFIVWDTVRASSLSLFGHSHPNTPSLEKLAKSGIVFPNAIATSPYTLPSHATMFTGQFANKVIRDRTSPINDHYPTLAGYLKDQGYLTAGFVGNKFYCSYEFGMNRGFTHYEDYFGDLAQIPYSVGWANEFIKDEYLWKSLPRDVYQKLTGYKTASKVNKDFLSWLSHQDPSEPFFVFLNYLDAHYPYLPPKEFAEKFNIKYDMGANWRKLKAEVQNQISAMEPTDIQALSDLYDACIAYLDDETGKLLAELDKRVDMENTIVVLVSDHGEQFGEHALMDHANSLYMPLLHVPLLLSSPQRLPSDLQVAAPISLVDLPATILEMAGHTGKIDTPGLSLARFWNNGPKPDKPLLSEVEQADWLSYDCPVRKGPLKSIYYDGLHYIKHYGEEREELYDLTVDPGELDDLANLQSGKREIDKFSELLNGMLSGKQV